MFGTQLYWLKREDGNALQVVVEDVETPHEFLCPITHEVMKEPVRCSGKEYMYVRRNNIYVL